MKRFPIRPAGIAILSILLSASPAMSEKPETKEAPFSLSYENYNGLSDSRSEPASSYTVRLDSATGVISKSVLKGPSGSPGMAIGLFEREMPPEEAAKFLKTIRDVRLDTVGVTRSATPGVSVTKYKFKQRAREFEGVITPYDSEKVDQLMPLLMSLTTAYQELEKHPKRAVAVTAEEIWQNGKLSFEIIVGNVGSEAVEIARPASLPAPTGKGEWCGISIAEWQDENDPNPKHQVWHKVPIIASEEDSPTVELAKGETLVLKTKAWSGAVQGTRYVMNGTYGAPETSAGVKDPKNYLAGIANSSFSNFVAGEE